MATPITKNYLNAWVDTVVGNRTSLHTFTFQIEKTTLEMLTMKWFLKFYVSKSLVTILWAGYDISSPKEYLVLPIANVFKNENI